MCDRDTDLLLPLRIQDWVPADQVVRFIVPLAAPVLLQPLHFKQRWTGREQDRPRIMLGLLMCYYSVGSFASREVQRATHKDAAVQFVAGNSHPDHATIVRFRRENQATMSSIRPGELQPDHLH